MTTGTPLTMTACLKSNYFYYLFIKQDIQSVELSIIHSFFFFQAFVYSFNLSLWLSR